MRRIRYFVETAWAERLLAQWMVSIMIAVNFGFGAVILVGGEARFVKPSYEPLIELAQGHLWLWGVWILLSASLMATPLRWPNILGLWLGMFWHMVWMACFAKATMQYQDAAGTAVIAYSGFSMIMAALLTARVLDKSGE